MINSSWGLECLAVSHTQAIFMMEKQWSLVLFLISNLLLFWSFWGLSLQTVHWFIKKHVWPMTQVKGQSMHPFCNYPPPPATTLKPRCCHWSQLFWEKHVGCLVKCNLVSQISPVDYFLIYKTTIFWQLSWGYHDYAQVGVFEAYTFWSINTIFRYM